MERSKRRKFLELAGIGAGGVLLMGAKECDGGAGPLAKLDSALRQSGPSALTVYDVRTFGASSAGDVDAGPAIQLAIDTAYADADYTGRGGIIYFAPGEYLVETPLIIRRGRTDLPNGAAKYQGLHFLGAGGQSSILHGKNLASSVPMLQFDPDDPAQPSAFYAFEDLYVIRDTEGPVLVHSQNASGSAVLSYTTFRNVQFVAAHTPNATPATGSAVLIQGGFHLTFDNVVVSGCESALRLMNTSHVVMNTISTASSWSSVAGVRIDGGTNYVINNFRPWGLDGGVALALGGGVSSVTVNNFASEGKATSSHIVVDDAQDVVLLQPNFPNALPGSSYAGYGRATPTYAQHGLWVTGNARDVRVLGGTAGTFQNAPVQPSYAVRVDAGARHVHIDGLRLLGDPLADVHIDSAAIDARINYHYVGAALSLDFGGSRGSVFFDSTVQSDGRVAGWIDSSNRYLLGSDTLRLGAGNTLTSLPEGYEGQRLTCVFEGAVTVDVTGNIRLAGGSSFAAADGNTLQLVYSRALWRELSRA